MVSRSDNLVPLRLGLALMVVLAHAPELLDGGRAREPLTWLFGTVSAGELAVDGFFLLSGWLITASLARRPDVGAYLARRALRIMPAFLVAFAVSLFVFAPLAGGDLGALFGMGGARQAARALTLQTPWLPGAFAGRPVAELNGSMWTMAYEARCYLLAVPLLPFVMRAGRAAPLLAALLIAIGSHGADLLPPVGAAWRPLIGTLPETCSFTGLFCAGACFWRWREAIPWNGRLAGLALAALLAGLASPALHPWAIAGAGGYLLFWLAWHAPPLAWPHGDSSYGLYLYAWPVENLLAASSPSMSPWLLFPLAALVAGALGITSWYVIERPALALARLRPRAHGVQSAAPSGT